MFLFSSTRVDSLLRLIKVCLFGRSKLRRWEVTWRLGGSMSTRITGWKRLIDLVGSLMEMIDGTLDWQYSSAAQKGNEDAPITKTHHRRSHRTMKTNSSCWHQSITTKKPHIVVAANPKLPTWRRNHSLPSLLSWIQGIFVTIEHNNSDNGMLKRP